MAQHAFIAMPFGMKEGIDFNKVYSEYIKPALEGAGFEVFRADEEQRAGNIRTDMFQELLLADLVVSDLSIDNPNVWYELGVRHALRARGVVQIQCKREYLPFDVYADRTLQYHIKDGRPDTSYLEADKQALANVAVETVTAWQGRRVSPVYHLLRFLKEPDWRSLRVDEAREFWEAQEAWTGRIEVARKADRPGDILTLADEAPSRVLRLETHRTAGEALLSLGQFALSLEQYERALALDPADIESRQKKGVLLSRLKKHDAAKEWLEAMLKDRPNDAESLARLARVEKDAWIDAWRDQGKTPAEMRRDAAYEDALLREAIDLYARGFREDPTQYYLGSNAVTLMHLLYHLTGDDKQKKDCQVLEGGVRWIAQNMLAKNPKNYWARVAKGDLEVLTGDTASVERAYRDAVAVVDKNWFKLDSPRQQLTIMKDLGFRPAEVETALAVMDRALNRLQAPEARWIPRFVFLFGGHMIDRPGRTIPRFPADKEAVAAAAIAAKLDELGAGSDDLALCGAACGGQLLFAEGCLQRGLRLEVRIPLDEPAFLEESVRFAGGAWVDRYYRVKADPKTRLLIMPEELGPIPKGTSPYTRESVWQVYSALARGPEKVRFICLWNQQGGDGPGGTQHMYEAIRRYSGRIHIIDTTALW